MNVLKKYTWLVGTLMRAGDKGLTLEQIGDRWNATEELHEEGAFARRSFHRHRIEIMDLFGIEIECYVDGGQYRYRLADDGGREYFRQWMMDSIAVSHVVADSREAAQYISVEPTNDTALPIILEALKECRKVEFDYKPYWADTATHYFDFQPHAIKMFERRWYLIGRYKKDMPFLILALDRIDHFEIREAIFRRDPDFNLEELFDGAFGITVGDGEVESVWLEVEEHQANYLRSLPLHRSQMELTSRHEGFALFALRVRLSYDLRQRILSLGSTVEVLKPESLRNEIREEAKAMLAKYQEDDA